MAISKVTVSYLTSLESFELHSHTYYLVCAALIIFMNLFIMFLFTVMKFPRGQSNNVILFNLALSDFFYEAISTPLLLQCGCYESSIPVNCTSMYYVYLTFNISTVLHIVSEITEKLLNAYFAINHQSSIGYHASVSCSLLVWCGSGILAYASSNTAFLSEEGMILVGRFKVFGYVLFGVVAFSATVLLLTRLCFIKPVEIEKTTEKDQLVLVMEDAGNLDDLETPMASHNLQLRNEPIAGEPRDELALCCLFLAFFVGWFGWLAIGEDNEILRSLEIMKSFECIRLAARLLNPVVLLYTF